MPRLLTLFALLILAVPSEAGCRRGGGLFHRRGNCSISSNSCGANYSAIPNSCGACNSAPQAAPQHVQQLHMPTPVQVVPTANVGGGCFGGVCNR